MRFGTIAGRAVILVDKGAVDIASASGGRFPAEATAVFDRWQELRDWAASELGAAEASPYAAADLGPPSPAPRQIFAIGLNYKDHAAEAGVAPPESPPTFTKYVSCLSGPETELELPSGNVDWEIELVAVIGRKAKHVPAEKAWDHVAGLAVGQDYSERVVQGAGPVPQFSLGKSFPGFGPVGPWIVTPDAFADPEDLAIECRINGEVMQSSRTSQLIFPLSELIARLSAVCELLPGDIIFTGTPGGVGAGRDPKVFLKPGDEVVSQIEGIGSLRQRCVSAA